MFYIRFILFLLILQSTLIAQSAGETAKIDPPKELTPEEIIRKFSAKETEFYEAWKQYYYYQTAEFQVLAVDGQPIHEKMTTITEVVFNDNGTRDIKVLRRAGGIFSVVLTPEDEEVVNNLQPFAFTEKELPQYDLTFEGKEKVDELTCYVFSVAPKTIQKGKMYFQGKIWVDDQDLQIVRTFGKPVPQTKKEQYPKFETIRQIIDKKYWFPVWTHGESTLHFGDKGDRKDVRIEQTVTYERYKRFDTDTKIHYENQEKQ
jgi:hypothetical protein